MDAGESSAWDRYIIDRVNGADAPPPLPYTLNPTPFKQLHCVNHSSVMTFVTAKPPSPKRRVKKLGLWLVARNFTTRNLR